jgi:hypothetical protein
MALGPATLPQAVTRALLLWAARPLLTADRAVTRFLRASSG